MKLFTKITSIFSKTKKEKQFDFDIFLSNYFAEKDLYDRSKMFDNFPKDKKLYKEVILKELTTKIKNQKTYRLFDWLVFAYHDGLDDDYTNLFITLLNSDFHKLHREIVNFLSSFENKVNFTDKVFDLGLKDLDYIKIKHDKWAFKYNCFLFLKKINTPESIKKGEELDSINGFTEWEIYVKENVKYK